MSADADERDPSVFVINVEDHPEIDMQAEDWKEHLSFLAFKLSTPEKYHAVFKHKGESIGEMIVRPGFEEKERLQ